MDDRYVKYGVRSRVYLPGLKRRNLGAKYRRDVPLGTWGKEQVSLTNIVKQKHQSPFNVQNGPSTFYYQIPRRDGITTKEALRLPRGGNVMRIVGTGSSEAPVGYAAGDGAAPWESYSARQKNEVNNDAKPTERRDPIPKPALTIQTTDLPSPLMPASAASYLDSGPSEDSSDDEDDIKEEKQRLLSYAGMQRKRARALEEEEISRKLRKETEEINQRLAAERAKNDELQFGPRPMDIAVEEDKLRKKEETKFEKERAKKKLENDRKAAANERAREKSEKEAFDKKYGPRKMELSPTYDARQAQALEYQRRATEDAAKLRAGSSSMVVSPMAISPPPMDMSSPTQGGKFPNDAYAKAIKAAQMAARVSKRRKSRDPVVGTPQTSPGIVGVDDGAYLLKSIKKAVKKARKK